MSYSEVLIIYLSSLTLQAVVFGLMAVISPRTAERKRSLSRGEKRYVMLRLLVFVFVPALGWLMYCLPLFYSLIIPITAFLDLGGMAVMMLSSDRLIRYFDRKHAA